MGLGNLYESCEERISDIKLLLDSKFDQEKIVALKRLIAIISKGKSVRAYFPDVVKNVASSNFEVRKLVYIYLLRYAEEEPDLALLSINTFQRDLTDRNPMIRAMALRVMSGIRGTNKLRRLPLKKKKVLVISPLIMLALKKGIVDMSPYVRKAAANALPKLVNLDPNQHQASMDMIEQLLNDNSTLVLGSAVQSMIDLCPDRYELIHKHYRKLCMLLLDADEWAQIEIMEILLKYARVHFVDPNSVKNLDPDHMLLITSTKPILQSRNPAAVLSASRLLIHLSPSSMLEAPTKALLRLLQTTTSEHQFHILQNLRTVANLDSSLLAMHARSFVVFAGDAGFVNDLKMEIMGLIACASNAAIIVSELKALVRCMDVQLAIKAVKLVGTVCAKIDDLSVREVCLAILVGLLASDQELIVAESVIVTRRLLMDQTAAGSTATAKTTALIISLARSLDAITVPMARASILWLIGHHSPAIPKIAHDAFRTSVKSFKEESQIVKLQVLTLGAKLMAASGEEELGADGDTNANANGDSARKVEIAAMATVRLLWVYLCDLARFDSSWDVRDRARLLRGLVDAGSKKGTGLFAQNLGKILMAPKFAPSVAGAGNGDINPGAPSVKFTIGSLSHAFGLPVRGYSPLPEWAKEVTGSDLRDAMEKAQPTVWHPPARSVSVRNDASSTQVASALGSTSVTSSAPNSSVPSRSSSSRVTNNFKKKYDGLESFLDSSDEEEVQAKPLGRQPVPIQKEETEDEEDSEEEVEEEVEEIIEGEEEAEEGELEEGAFSLESTFDHPPFSSDEEYEIEYEYEEVEDEAADAEAH
ncbi:AP-3 complex subunit beta-2 [Entophlyctis sp. JEL0112]|nr:AP-3 complex subunit beta-2 [Entophlyctis sp. JEL0112]